MSEQPNYYSIIPANVRYDKSLKANEKLLYGEITALSNQKGYCWAENNYFAKLFDVSKETVSRWVSNLEKNGYVRTELIYGKDKQVKERRIHMADPLLTKTSIPPRQNNQYPIDENVKEELNITSTNTTSINNDNDNAQAEDFENLKIQTQKTEEPKPEESKQQDSKVIHQFYQENFGIESPYIAQELEYWADDLNVELVLEALKRAVEYGGEFGYAKRIMKNWLNKSIDTMDKVKQADVAFEQKNTKKYNQQSKPGRKDEKLPDWAKEENEKPIHDEVVPEDEQKSMQERLERLRRLREEKLNE